MKTIKSIFVLLAFMHFTENAYAGDVVNIDQQSCKFSVSMPDGWDSIPSSEVRKKLGDMPISLALYPRKQNSYFVGNYVLISVMPTIKPLANFNFKEIVADIEKMAKETQTKQTDSLRVEQKKIDNYISDSYYHICTDMQICKDSVSITCLQDLLLTKFGYISVSCYAKDGCALLQPRDVAKLISKNITVDEDYRYEEPENTSVFSIRNIAISLVIGILVFIIITFVGKKKK